MASEGILRRIGWTMYLGAGLLNFNVAWSTRSSASLQECSRYIDFLFILFVLKYFSYMN